MAEIQEEPKEKKLQDLSWNSYVSHLPGPLQHTMSHEIWHYYQHSVCSPVNTCILSREKIPLPLGDNLLEEIEMLEDTADTIRDSNSTGRTGNMPSCIIKKMGFDEEDQTFEIRFDDISNLEFWLQTRIPLTKIMEMIPMEVLSNYIQKNATQEEQKQLVLQLIPGLE